MPAIRRIGLSTATATLLAATCLIPTTTASGQTAQTLSAGQQEILTNPPGVNFHTPVDPRLNTYGVHAQVAGVAFAGQAGVGSELVLAAPGAELAVVHLKGTYASSLDNDLDPSYDRMTLRVTLTSGSVSANLPGLDNPAGAEIDDTVAVAIPKGAPATLGISMGGLLPQSFDLRSLRRIGTSPAALYRSPNDTETVVDSSTVQTLNINTSAGPATGQFSLKETTLAYWLPGSTTLAPSPDQAYLSLYFRDTNLKLGDGTDLNPDALPGSAVQIVLPDGSTLPTTYIALPSSIDLLDGIYYALVPADITSAKILVNPGTSVQASDPSHNTLTLNIPSPLTTTVAFPPAWTPPPVYGPLTTAVSHRSQGQSATWVWPVVAVLLLALAGCGFLFTRGRRQAWVPVRALDWPPRGLPPATVALLSGRARLALPPGSPADAGSATSSVPPSDAPVLVIRLLGPLEVEGLRKPITRKAVKRLLVCLAVSGGRPLSAEELSVGISDHPERDPKTTSVQSYASMLRSSLPEGTLPDAGETGGYLLDPSKVVVDLAALTTAADAPDDRPGWAERARAALELVRDVPLVGGRWEGIEPAARLIAAGVEGLARNLSSHLRSSGDPDGADWAVSKGLAAVPKSLGLWQDRLDAAADGSGYGLERAWTDAQKELGPDAALLLAHYHQLRRGLGEQPAASL